MRYIDITGDRSLCINYDACRIVTFTASSELPESLEIKFENIGILQYEEFGVLEFSEIFKGKAGILDKAVIKFHNPKYIETNLVIYGKERKNFIKDKNGDEIIFQFIRGDKDKSDGYIYDLGGEYIFPPGDFNLKVITEGSVFLEF